MRLDFPGIGTGVLVLVLTGGVRLTGVGVRLTGVGVRLTGVGVRLTGVSVRLGYGADGGKGDGEDLTCATGDRLARLVFACALALALAFGCATLGLQGASFQGMLVVASVNS